MPICSDWNIKEDFMKRLLVALSLMLGLLPVAANAADFSDWSTLENLGPEVNSDYVDSCVAISKNGLSLFFSSTRHTGNQASTDRDLYVTKRDSIIDPWGPPTRLTMLNSPVFDSCPALSLDEHLLYFSSSRPSGCGSNDIYVSRRHDRHDDLGWETPVNVNPECNGVNSPYNDQMPTFFEDEKGKVVMYFASNRGDKLTFDIYQSDMKGDDTLGPAFPVFELNSTYGETGSAVRHDGLEIIFLSNRNNPPDTSYPQGIQSFWMATRASTTDPWSEPKLIPSLGIPAYAQGRIALSFDGRELYFTSNRAGNNWDIWVAKREKLKSNDKCEDKYYGFGFGPAPRVGDN